MWIHVAKFPLHYYQVGVPMMVEFFLEAEALDVNLFPVDILKFSANSFKRFNKPKDIWPNFFHRIIIYNWCIKFDFFELFNFFSSYSIHG